MNNSGHTDLYAKCCEHIFEGKAQVVYRHFTGEGYVSYAYCEVCHKNPAEKLVSLCKQCTKEKVECFPQVFCGKPQVINEDRNFNFSTRVLKIENFENHKISKVASLGETGSEALVFTRTGQLLKVDLKSGRSQIILNLQAQHLDLTGELSLVIAPAKDMVAITSRKLGPDDSSNSGVVVDLHSGKVIYKLDCGDYHVAHTQFPVAFFEHRNQTLMVHATDWNRLDISDPLTGKCLTERDYDDMPEEDEDDDDIAFTEWSGRLLISPDNHTIGTIGWVWHPIGQFFHFGLKKWLKENIWEPERGDTLRSYGAWSYFWHESFFWIDSDRVCIYGYDVVTQDETYKDDPPPSVVIYNVKTQSVTDWFFGPTLDPFIYDKFLFSGIDKEKGLSVWDLDSGNLLCEHIGLEVKSYHPGLKTFINFNEDLPGHVELTHWYLAER